MKSSAKTITANALSMLLVICAASEAGAWRSALYPQDWTPALRDGQGRFLHDFSYAGYRAGEAPLPNELPQPEIDVTQAPYHADPSGSQDATAAIQNAIDDLGAGGGGTLYLPTGTYRISPAEGAMHALHLRHSNVVLRGDGPALTRIYNAGTDMRGKNALLVSPRTAYYTWYWDLSDQEPISSDLDAAVQAIPVADVTAFAVGDRIVAFSDATPEFIAEHGMTDTWFPDNTPGPMFYRSIVAIDTGAGVIHIDAPTRYPLKVRDNARIAHTIDPLSEVGIQDLALGNLQNTTPGMGDHDYDIPGSGAYQVHASFLVFFNHVVDGWMRNVHTFRPAANSADVHVLSNGVRLDSSRHVTLDGIDFRNTQYKGAGGNGYLVVLAGNDCLVTNSQAQNGRHNYTFSFMFSNGNVIHRSSARNPRLPVDFHQRLAMANLIDNMTLDSDNIEAAFRDCCGHGHSTTESVFWNSNGLSYPDGQFFEYFRLFIVQSQQYGHGYVIGTRGDASNIWTPGGDGTEPQDFAEGAGTGDSLEPASLYEDQLRRRIGPAPVDAGGGSDSGSSGDVAVADGGEAPDSAIAPPDAGGLGDVGVDDVNQLDHAMPDATAADVDRDSAPDEASSEIPDAAAATGDSDAGSAGAERTPPVEGGCDCAQGRTPAQVLAGLSVFAIAICLRRRSRRRDGSDP